MPSRVSDTVTHEDVQQSVSLAEFPSGSFVPIGKVNQQGPYEIHDQAYSRSGCLVTLKPRPREVGILHGKAQWTGERRSG